MERRKIAERDQQQRAPQACPNILPNVPPLAMRAGDGIRKRHADQEGEARLDRIVQRASGPIDVRLVVSQEAPEPVAREGLRDARELQHLGHHEQHDEAAVRIHRNVAWNGLRNPRSFPDATVVDTVGTVACIHTPTVAV